MSLTREEIADLALRYISPEEQVDFPLKNDVFFIQTRSCVTDRVLKDDEGWVFGGYGICSGYSFDEEAKPRGKWIWMHFSSLSAFPPLPQVLKLQPPHIVKGQFQSADRTHDLRIVKVALENNSGKVKETPQQKNGLKNETKDNVVAFRLKGKA